MTHIETAELIQFASSLQRDGHNYEEISLQLREKGATDTLLQEIIEKVKSIRLSKRRKSGFTYCTIGVSLLVIGCMITLFLYTSGHDIKIAMYGLTTLGIIFTFKGLVDIFGW